MSEIKWDQTGERRYETGTKKGVLYPKTAQDGGYDVGVAWNGLTAVTDSPSGAEESALYADDRKYLGLRSAEEYGCTIECYTYPDQWMLCDGSAELAPGVTVGQQTHVGFGFSYVTTVGNDVKGDQYGYKIHLVYNAIASPSEKSYASINDSPEAVTFSYEVTTTPVEINTEIDGKKLKPSATIVIDSTKFTTEEQKNKLKTIENKLYGTENSDPELPTPDQIIAILNGTAAIVDETPGDGNNG